MFRLFGEKKEKPQIKVLARGKTLFKDHFQENGFLHDVGLENIQSSWDRRYPIINVY